jgi:hypothetical protein
VSGRRSAQAAMPIDHFLKCREISGSYLPASFDFALMSAQERPSLLKPAILPDRSQENSFHDRD